MTRARRAAVVIGAVVVLGLGGCGAGHKSEPAPTTASRPASASPSATERRQIADKFEYLQDADCELWKSLPGAKRSELLSGFKSFFGARVDAADTSGQRGTSLNPARAKHVFDRYCRLTFAAKFKLYKIYGRSAAFTSRR